VPCSNAAKTRNPLKFAGVPQTRQRISAISRPTFTILLADKFLSTTGYILQKNGFKLHKFQPKSGKLKIHREDEVAFKVLGVSRNVERDKFLPLASFQPVSKLYTKREIMVL